MLEKQLEDKCRTHIKRLNGECIKLTNSNGIPDRLILLPGGIAVFTEFKRPKSSRKPDPQQDWWLNHLQTLGFHAFWSKDLRHFERTIDSARGVA